MNGDETLSVGMHAYIQLINTMYVNNFQSGG